MISRLHLVTDDRVLGAPDFVSAAEQALEAGAGRISLHLRGPRGGARRLWELGLALRRLASATDTSLIVNDRVDLALALAADGAQLAARSLPLFEARGVLGSALLIGCSVHQGAEAETLANAASSGVSPDFLFAGAIFSTRSHPDRSPSGTQLIRNVRGALPSVPVLGIGGVTPDRVQEVVEAGAYGVAVVRAVWDAPDPGDAVRQLLEELRPRR